MDYMKIQIEVLIYSLKGRYIKLAGYPDAPDDEIKAGRQIIIFIEFIKQIAG
ncbi:hypothetical protein RGU76_28710 [Bacillus pseudomycoides]|uniref:hypothetical protein n=1 Tax=Bacillus pseudomycoides TaxID=64104 RepID=UPI0028534BF4|nr:hypothetical protein [Bacillus pseudomycoides]MDR4918803.1 hypothetical protein [Bacillus pseudomycoides]